MFSARQSARAGRVPVAALLILTLSILLHLALLRSVTAPSRPVDAAPPPAPVIVHLQPAFLPTPLPPPAPPKPARKRKASPKPPATPAVPVAPAEDLAAGKAPVQSTQPQTSQATGPDDQVQAMADRLGLPADTPAADQLDLSSPDVKPAPPLRATPPPSAALHYKVEARRSDGNYQGSGTIRFSQDAGTYSVEGEVKLMFLSLLSFRSSGQVQQQGLAPTLYTEKRLRRPSTNTHFQREAQIVSFSASTLTYPRSGQEQDRASIVWQLAALGLGDPAQLAAGTELGIFVAGTRDGETWHLQVAGEEPLAVAGARRRTLHVVRQPKPGSYEQRLDIWLAPDLHWYPVKLRFTEPNGDELDLSLTDAPEALSAN